MARKRSKSPAPFIIGGVTIVMAVIALVLALNQGAVVDVRGPKGEALDEAPPGSTAGPKPFVNPVTGTVKAVDDYLQEVLHDPEVQYAKWGPLRLVTDEQTGEQSWHVLVKWRGRNRFNALVLSEDLFIIRQGKVVRVIEGDDH